MPTRPKAPERPQTKTRQRDADLCIALFLRDRLMGRTKSGTNAKLHAVTDAAGRPLRMFLADCGDDADWIDEALEEMGISPCITSRKRRKVAIRHDAER